jgi:sortase (surface protein transpeptidase)
MRLHHSWASLCNTMKNHKRIGENITLGSLIVAASIFIRAVFFSPDTGYLAMLAPVTQSLASIGIGATHNNPLPPYEPARLKIPSIKVSAKIQNVGEGKSGNMAVPSNFTDVGWYRSGTVPGEVGSAVMDGHVDNALALPGVFKHLGELEIGDEVDVVNNEGKTLHFRVTGVDTYEESAAPISQIFSSTDGLAHLNLITCTGDWIQEDKSYNERLVVYTTLVN